MFIILLITLLIGAVLGIVILCLVIYPKTMETDRLLNDCRQYICGDCRIRTHTHLFGCDNCDFKRLRKYVCDYDY
jgi:hypothetical protein